MSSESGWEFNRGHASPATPWARRSAAGLNRDRVRELTQRRWVCDAEAAWADFELMPEMPLGVGVPATAAWYREAGWL